MVVIIGRSYRFHSPRVLNNAFLGRVLTELATAGREGMWNEGEEMRGCSIVVSLAGAVAVGLGLIE